MAAPRCQLQELQTTKVLWICQCTVLEVTSAVSELLLRATFISSQAAVMSAWAPSLQTRLQKCTFTVVAASDRTFRPRPMIGPDSDLLRRVEHGAFFSTAKAQVYYHKDHLVCTTTQRTLLEWRSIQTEMLVSRSEERRVGKECRS